MHVHNVLDDIQSSKQAGQVNIKDLSRKAHKNRVFIINSLSAKSIWVKVKFRVKVKFGVKVKFEVKVKFGVKVKLGVKVKFGVKVKLGVRWSLSVCVCGCIWRLC